MTKAEIVNEIVKKMVRSPYRVEADKTRSLRLVEAILEELQVSVAAGDAVIFSDFGTFMPKFRAAKPARAIKKNEIVMVPARFRPGFKPAKNFIDELNAVSTLNAPKSE